MTTTRVLLTSEDLLALPRDGNRYELIRGVLVARMGTGDPHAVTVTRIAGLVFNYTEANDYGAVRSGEPGYHLDFEPDTVRCPDVAWVAPGRIPEGTRGYPELAPDLAIEVKSPSNSNPEMAAKAWMWLSYGSRQVWIADTERLTVTVYRHGVEPLTLGEDDLIDGGELLPGFSCPVWQFFRRHR